MADLVLVNGRILTLDNGHHEAEAVAVRDGLILEVGKSRRILSLAGDGTERIDLEGKLVIPGLTDAHGHLMSLGTRLASLDLTETGSVEEILERVRLHAAGKPASAWILGRGWDQNDWPDKRFPHHRGLTGAAPRNPVFLRRIDGHAVWVNSRALELAGIDASTKDPEGGRILREGGRPTGVLIDSAVDLVETLIPPPSRNEQMDRLETAAQACLRSGLTSIHDAGVDRERIGLYRDLIDQGRLGIRVYAMLGGTGPMETPDLSEPPLLSYGDGMLAVRSIKLGVDGALGSRGAALLEPYSDDPDNSGLIVRPPGEIASIAERALRMGYQVSVHAIGDRGNRLVLDAFQETFQKVPEGRKLRNRIEHAQILSAEDLPRLADLGIIASMQPTHCTSDMYWAGERLGEARTAGAYAWRTLLNSGARLVCGSDFPVESEEPLRGIYAAVTREDPSGWPEGGWHPEEKLTVQEAIRCFTEDAAYAAFEEDWRGTIEAGKWADFTVLSKDITRIPHDEILTTEVEFTIVGGNVAYRKGS